jgi:GNAT superfamily N-acetyltransferase
LLRAWLDSVPELLPLVRGYCEFYAATPPDSGIEEVCRARIADPEREGPLLVAEDEDEALAGFAALSWKASHLHGGRVAYLYDLFVAERARGSGYADALIAACADEARAHGCVAMDWLTAPDNARARAVYERVGAIGEPQIEYELEL